jgi:hypothetical protein
MCRRQLHLNAAAVFHHVEIGHDVTVRAEDHAGACASLSGKQAGLRSFGAFFSERGISRRETPGPLPAGHAR